MNTTDPHVMDFDGTDCENEPVEVFLYASAEITEFLIENEIEVSDLLRDAGLNTRQRLASDPARGTGTGAKEPVTVILATSALILSLTPILSRAISALTHRPIVVREKQLVQILDAAGRPVLDSQGQPRLEWVERARLL